MPQQQQQCSVNSQEWYLCPIPITIFCIFLFLFIYSLVAVYKCSRLIYDKNLEEKGVTINQVFSVYLTNIIITFVSLLILFFFLYRLLPKKLSEELFSDYLGIVVSLYILIISSMTIHLFSKTKDVTKGDINSIGGLALAFSCIAIIIYSLKIYVYMKYGAQNLSFKSLNQAVKKKKLNNQ